MADTVSTHDFGDTSHQPIELRRRRDIQISASEFQGEKCWILKDPVTLKYYRVREPEFLVFNMLDGASTFHQIQTALSRLFGGSAVEEAHVRGLVGSLYQRGLLVGKRFGQATRLLERRSKLNRMRWFGRFTNLLSIRFPGVDPERFLNWLYPKTSWLFHPWAVLCCIALVIAAGLLVVLNANEVVAKLPQMQQFFGIQNLVLMGLLLVITKSMHELGHGLACKHYGGECHEIGFMLLVLMPVMYCNTTDSWVLKNKWHRIIIGAAGMYVEVILASICTFVWWYANPGLLSYICLNIMFLSSITTVVFNANPLLRFDGYYILSDFLEIPNMTLKSRAALLSKLRSVCLGLPALPARMLPQKNQFAFASYSVASFFYRWIVLFAILWFISKVFEPYGLQIIGQYMIGVSLIGLIVIPSIKFYKFFSNPLVRAQVNRLRLAVTTFLIGVILIGILFVPVPQYVYAPFVIRPQNAKLIYVKHPGVLLECFVVPGQRVKQGDPIALLQDLGHETRLKQVEGEAKSLETEIELLSQIETIAPLQVQQLSSRLAQLQTVTNRWVTERRIYDALLLKATADGTILPPGFFRAADPDPKQLDRWTGSPLDKENLLAYLERDTEFCRIDTTNRFEAVLEIDQADVDLVKPDCSVNLLFKEYPSIRFQGRVQEVATNDTAASGPAATQYSPGGMAGQVDVYGRPLGWVNSYQAIVPLSGEDQRLLSGFSGEAKINVGNTPLGRQLLRYIQIVFNFR